MTKEIINKIKEIGIKCQKVGDIIVAEKRYEKIYIFPISFLEIPDEYYDDVTLLPKVFEEGDEEEINYYKIVNFRGDMEPNRFSIKEVIDFLKSY